MASEPFEITDANGITVRGGVDVFRRPEGPFNDSRSPYYRNPRWTDFDIVYNNTREACTIDRDTLSEAVQNALSDAIIKFGIPGPNAGEIRRQVEAAIDAYRQRCIANADKYASNETDSATDWVPGKPGPRGTIQPEMPQRAVPPPVGLVSGKPMSFYPVQPPIWDFSNNSTPNEDAGDWPTRLLRSIRSQ